MKKKIVLLFLLIILLCGCSNEELTNEKKIYNKYISELEKINSTTESYPFDIEVNFIKITDKILQYQVIIDNVKENIYDIEALAIHDVKTEDIFPSIGIFDDKEDLEVGKKPLGIALAGYIDYEGNYEDFNCELKLIIKYKDKDKKENTVYYLTKK